MSYSSHTFSNNENPIFRFATPYLNNLNLKYLVREIVKCRDLSKEEMGTAEPSPPPLETVNEEIDEEQTVDDETDEQRE